MFLHQTDIEVSVKQRLSKEGGYLLYLQGIMRNMSWSNPTPDEATEAYHYYKKKYTNAAQQKSASEKQEQAYRSQRGTATSQMESLSSQKLNFEKRLSGIENIIKMLEGNGGWLSTNVPRAISKASSSITKADDSYRRSVRVSGGVAVASLETAFATKTVEGDPNSSSALQKYKAEKARLEQEIEALKSQIASLSSLISSLSSKISACNSTQASLRSAMNSSAYEMNHYRSYMY